MGIANKALQPLGYDIAGFAFPYLAKTWVLQRQYHWQLFLPHTINGVFGPFISSFCQDIRFRNYSIGQISTLQYGAFQRFYAGLQNIDTISMNFITSVDNAVLDYFYGWYDLMIDKDGFYSPKNNYKKTIYVALYDRSGVESVRFTLHGTFPRNKPIVPLSYGSDDMLRLAITLNVDYIEMYSLIGSVRSAVTNVVGDVARKTKEVLGSVGGAVTGKISKAGNIIPK